MKRFYILALFMALAGFASAQAIIVTPSNSVSGNVEEGSVLDLWIYFQNNTGADTSMEWARTASNIDASWTYTICDYNVCYFGDHAGAVMGPIAAGNNGYLKVSVASDPGETGSGFADYTVWIEGDSANTAVDVSFTFNVLTTVDDSQLDNVLMIYPNPATNELNMAAANGKLDKGSMNIYDMNGRLLLSHDVKGVTNTTLNVSSLPEGSYMMRYNTGKTTITRRFVKRN